MATISWSNGVSGDWSNAADWAPEQVPGSADTAEIGPGISVDTAWTVSVTTDEFPAMLLVAAGGFGTLSIAAVLDVADGISVASGSVVLQAGGTLATAGALTLGSSGTMPSSATLTADGTGLIAAASMGIFDGSVLAPGSAAVALGNADIAAGFFSIGSNASVTCDTATIATNVNNSGSIEVEAVPSGESPGTLTVTGSLVDAGQITVDAGALLAVDSTLAVNENSSLVIDAGAELTSGTLASYGGTVTASGATIDVTLLSLYTGSASFIGGTITQTGTETGTISASVGVSDGAILTIPPFTLVGQLDLSGGTVAASGVVTLDGGTIELTNGASETSSFEAGGLEVGWGYAVSVITLSGGVMNLGTDMLVDDDTDPTVDISSDGVLTLGTELVASSDMAITIASGGVMTIGAATPTPGAIAIANGATLAASSTTISANVLLDGDFINTGDGDKTTAGTLTGDGTLSILDAYKAESVVLVQNAQAFTGSVTIENGSIFILDAGSMPSAVIHAVESDQPLDHASDAATIDLSWLSYEAYNLPIYNATTGLLTVGSATLDVGLGHKASDFGVADASGLLNLSGTDVTIAVVQCFLAGTRIRTPDGEAAVETLRPGDVVTTVLGARRRLRWVGFGRTLVTPRNRVYATPVVVRRHALGDNVPRRDLYLTCGHSLFLDGVLIPVEELVNHRSIAWVEDAKVVEYYHLELDSHDVVLAEGAAAETFREDENSPVFLNLSTRPAAPPVPPCAPVLHRHPIVERIWQALSDRAGPPLLTVTDDPNLHLLADGARLDAIAIGHGVWRFRLPGPVAELRIVSRSAIPALMGTGRDHRRLGVALGGIAFAQGGHRTDLRWDSECLVDGFHAPEPANGHRWTDGSAALPPRVLASLQGGATIDLHVADLLDRYVVEDAAGRRRSGPARSRAA